jgi:hypothetical protein
MFTASSHHRTRLSCLTSRPGHEFMLNHVQTHRVRVTQIRKTLQHLRLSRRRQCVQNVGGSSAIQHGKDDGHRLWMLTPEHLRQI